MTTRTLTKFAGILIAACVVACGAPAPDGVSQVDPAATTDGPSEPAPTATVDVQAPPAPTATVDVQAPPAPTATDAPAETPPAPLDAPKLPTLPEPPTGQGGAPSVEPEGGAGGSETGGATASGGTPTSTGGTSSTGGTPAATGGTVSTGGTSSTGGAPTPPARVTLWSADVNVTIVPNGTKFVWPTVRIESKNPTFAGCPATSVAWPYAANVGDSEGAIELTTDEGFAKFVQCAQRVTAPAATVLRVLAGCASTSDPSSCTDRRANDVADPVAALAGARELSVTRTVTTFGSNGDRLAVHFEITGLR